METVKNAPTGSVTVKVKPPAEQMSLMGFMDDSLGKVFSPKAIVDKTGARVGTVIGMKSRKDIAAALGVTNSKENKNKIDNAILAQSDEFLRKVKAEMAGLGGDWTGARLSTRTLASGVRQLSLVCKEIKRNTGPSDEEIAKSLKCTVADVQEMRRRQTEALEENTVESQ